MALTRDQKRETYAALVAQTPGLKLKGKASDYTAMNGNMFSFLSSDGVLAFRVHKDQRTAFIEAHPEAVVVQYNTVMKHYIGLPDALIQDGPAMEALWAQVVAHAHTLKPKPTTKPKKAKK